MFPERSTLLAAWQAQLNATGNPRLHQHLTQREQELLPRFAAYYDRLHHLLRRLRRALQRQWKCSLAGMALLMTLGAPPAMAAQINVGVGGCTLVDAITAANTDTATGGCATGSWADTIVLPSSSLQTLTAVNNTTFGATGLPVISSVITLQGNGSTITRDSSAPNFRILAVSGEAGNNGNLTLQNTTISGGSIPEDNTPYCYCYGNRIDDGGGIANYSGTVTLTNAFVAGNTAYSGGGGVYNTGTMTITRSTVSGNSATSRYGGVYNRGTMTITHSTIAGNSAYRSGGVFNTFSTMMITHSTVSGNSANRYSGVFNTYGTMTITNSTVSGNSATYGFGGVGNSGTMTITHSTVSGNSANYYGGMFNRLGTMTLSRSLISGNTSNQGAPEVYNLGRYATLNANDFNLFGANGRSGTNFAPGATDIVPDAGFMVSNILVPLANNGGPTRTRALVIGSPAIDAAGATCPANDQRDILRPQGAACDIGAFEGAVAASPLCNGNPITIFGTVGDDSITGTPGRDVIQALAGNDRVDARAGDDVICGGEGHDRLFGNVGNDIVSGGLGNDIARGDSGNDRLFGNDGDDILDGATGQDILRGGIGADLLRGGDQFDRLFGEGGNDQLFGQRDPDRLDGGAGEDNCDGGMGAGIDTAALCEATFDVP